LVFRDVSKQREAVQEIRRQSRRAQVLVESASRLNAQLELASVLDTVCNICNLALQASATAVYLEDARQDVFNLRAASTVIKRLGQLERKQFDLPGSLFRSLLSAKQPVAIISDVQSFPNVPYPEFFKEQNLHTLGMAGLYRRDDLIGVLISVFMGDPVQLPEDTQTLLKGLADQAAIAIINSSLFEQVRRGREHQKALTTRLVEIQEIERRHIARELHDQIGQVLTGLQFMLESLKTTSGEAQLVRIGETQETIIGLIEQIREMSLNLRPSMLDDLGLLPTLAWHFERYTKQTGIKVSFNSAGISERLNPEVETTVYRIVQEALTNIARHAQVTEALVRLVVRKNILGIEIIDHGVGFEPSFELSKTSTAGLAGMRERANLLGGDLVIKSVPRQGTKVMAMLPLERKAMERRNRDRDLGGG
jgi:signal transduction histidine kinase